MDTLVIVLIVVAAILLILFVGGLIASRRRARLGARDYSRHVSEADQALEAARAADRGWDRALLEEAARRALAADRPDWRYDELMLVLVDDRPGVTEDRAHLVAMGEGGAEARVILGRHDGEWVLERIE